MLARNSICSGRKSRGAVDLAVEWRASMNSTVSLRRVGPHPALPRGRGRLRLPLSRNSEVQAGDGVEEVGADGDDGVHRAGLDQLFRISSSLPRASPAELP